MLRHAHGMENIWTMAAIAGGGFIGLVAAWLWDRKRDDDSDDMAVW